MLYYYRKDGSNAFIILQLPLPTLVDITLKGSYTESFMPKTQWKKSYFNVWTCALMRIHKIKYISSNPKKNNEGSYKLESKTS